MSKVKRPENISYRVRSAETRVVRVKTEGAGLGVLKTLIVMAIILSQLALLIYLQIEMARAFRWYMSISLVLSAATCLYCLSSSKNSLSKAVWIILLLVGFSFGYILYFISDERIFFRKPKKRYKKIFSSTEQYRPDYQTDFSSFSQSVKNDAVYLKNSGEFAAYQNTSCRYFSSGAALFDDVLDECRRAEKFIFMEFFIVSDGVLMQRFLDIARDRASHGVDIRMIIDDMGSHKTLSGKMKKKLRDAGVKLVFFNRLVPIFSVALNYRDHRKIVVIDGKIGFSGGSNFADEYINEKRMYGYWKDTGIRICGAATDALTFTFLRQWQYITGREEDYSPFLSNFEMHQSNSIVIPYADGLDYSANIGKAVFENMISSAEEKIYIMTPYFITDDTITNLLTNKAASGVDVRIILPGVPDKAFVYGVSLNNAEKLSSHGVKVYKMSDAFVHSKLLLTENAVTVGSINMDLRSFYQQFEFSVYTNDEGLMASVEEDFSETFRESSLVTAENVKRKNIFRRIIAGVLQLFAPFM